MTVAPATQSAADFMSTAPKSLNGNTPWAVRYASELRRIWAEDAAQDPRTLQSHLGPSELGVECDRQVAGKLAALPTTNHVVDPWPSTRGRALHSHAAERVFPSENERTGVLRFVAEKRVTPHPEHPGTADLYDAIERAVVDHKFLGESSMAKIRKNPPRKYRGQLKLYGLGYHLLGLPVRRIVIAAYPATAGSMDGLYIWEEPFADENGVIDPATQELLTRSSPTPSAARPRPRRSSPASCASTTCPWPRTTTSATSARSTGRRAPMTAAPAAPAPARRWPSEVALRRLLRAEAP